MVKLRERGMSYRAIAEVTGVNATTVMRTMPPVANATPEIIVGKDGKRYAPNKNNGQYKLTFVRLCRRTRITHGTG